MTEQQMKDWVLCPTWDDGCQCVPVFSCQLLEPDPDIPILRAALSDLQDGVRSGAFTPEAANQILGNVADGLIAARKGGNKKNATPKIR